MQKVLPLVVSHGAFCMTGALLVHGNVVGGIITAIFGLAAIFAWSRTR